MLDDSGGRVCLMTLHAAKGLEFKAVFLTGLEEGIVPHDRALSDPDDLEEERRLCYVGITRARERLYLTSTWYRTLFGQRRDSMESRFVREIPDKLVEDVSGPMQFMTPAAAPSGVMSVVWGAPWTRASTVCLRSVRSLPPVRSTGAEELGLAHGGG